LLPYHSVAYPSLSQIFGNDTSTYNNYTSTIKAALQAYASQLASINNNATSVADLLDFFNLQYNLLVDSHVPAAEIIFYTSGSTFQSQFWSLLPFSRGSVHISSANTTKGATINPQYYSFSEDVTSQVYVAEYNRKAFTTAPFSSLVGAARSPSASTSTIAQWSNWVKDNFRANYHVMTSAAMLPRAKGGVVDSAAKVFGTSNVRVVDASIIPFQVCGHLTSTLYAVSERISDLIKAGQ
jgi:choline dehydrogenase-like flavoprotein